MSEHGMREANAVTATAAVLVAASFTPVAPYLFGAVFVSLALCAAWHLFIADLLFDLSLDREIMRSLSKSEEASAAVARADIFSEIDRRAAEDGSTDTDAMQITPTRPAVIEMKKTEMR